MMPLTMANSGETVTVKKITGKPEIRQHMAEMGFVVDEPVTVISRIGGNLIVRVRDSRVAIGKDMASKVMF